MHIYAFGSLCRGDVSRESDADLLALVSDIDRRFDPRVFSVYSYGRIQALWREGNPFAWHLQSESRLIFAEDGNDFIRELALPAPYGNCIRDCENFLRMFLAAKEEIVRGCASTVFELSTIFLGIRNIATCYSLGATIRPDFSRRSALRLGEDNIPVSEETFRVLERARLLATRGVGNAITDSETEVVTRDLDTIHRWMYNLSEKAKKNERLQ